MLTRQVLGLVDWNPSGVTILKAYKYGSRSLEGSRWTLPTLSWLGLKSDMLVGVSAAQLRPLTQRDRTLACTLLSSLTLLKEDAWCSELKEMSNRGYKADIECMYNSVGMAGLCDALARAVMRRQFV